MKVIGSELSHLVTLWKIPVPFLLVLLFIQTVIITTLMVSLFYSKSTKRIQIASESLLNMLGCFFFFQSAGKHV